METSRPPRYVATGSLSVNRLNLACVYPPLSRCESAAVGCTCPACCRWRSSPMSARLAQLMVDSCDAVIAMHQSDRKELRRYLRERLPAITAVMPDAFVLDFVPLFVSLKQSIELGKLPSPCSTAAEIVLHIVLDEVGLAIVTSGSVSGALAVSELAYHLPSQDRDLNIGTLRTALLGDDNARALWCDELVVGMIPRRTNVARNINWVPSLWFLPYGSEKYSGSAGATKTGPVVAPATRWFARGKQNRFALIPARIAEYGRRLGRVLGR